MGSMMEGGGYGEERTVARAGASQHTCRERCRRSHLPLQSRSPPHSSWHCAEVRDGKLTVSCRLQSGMHAAKRGPCCFALLGTMGTNRQEGGGGC